MLELTTQQAYLVFLILCLPIGLWVMWSDLKFMKIPNTAVVALAGVFAVAGILVLPFQTWIWQWLGLAIVLGVGFVLNLVARLGAGDAKFAAAAAPFVMPRDVPLVLVMLALFLLAAFVAHRLVRSIGPIRRMTPDWKSWTSKNFPMGLALVATLLAYLLMKAYPPLLQSLAGFFASMST